ncbi:glycosyltransferase family 2 protein [Clostridium arbusti]|uniref:glycosyltransferase family 2 protein n=1 Tax=Clostridium arbusti TaxID=1137848 RepID=UPI0002883F09|nr:glycosyltransferase family A protein [Clostridium arbusti]
MLNKISLVVPTINRTIELKKLLESVKECDYAKLEVIIVDQNTDIDISNIVNYFKEYFPINHIKVNFKGAAKARNYGVRYATGDIINFPDDDCELSKDLLSKVNNIFNEDTNNELIFGRSLDRNSMQASIVNFYKSSVSVRYSNIYRSTVEFTMFIKKNVFEELGGYDEELGVGTYFGAEEGADLVIRALSKSKKIMYYPDLLFYHPEKINKYGVNECLRGLSYARGAGALAYKHICINKNIHVFKLIIYINLKAMAAIIIYFFTFKFKKSRYYLYVLFGRIQGFFKKLKLVFQ